MAGFIGNLQDTSRDSGRDPYAGTLLVCRGCIGTNQVFRGYMRAICICIYIYIYTYTRILLQSGSGVRVPFRGSLPEPFENGHEVVSGNPAKGLYEKHGS